MEDLVTTVVLIRHADSDAGLRLCGSFDVPLSAGGRARLDALRLNTPARQRPDALYASTLARARETADALATAWGLQTSLEPRVAEIHCGEFEGLALDDIKRHHADLWARNAAQADEAFAWPGGESYAAFRARVLSAVGRIAARHPGQRVAIVTHAGVVSQILGTLKGRSAAAWSQDRPDPLAATEVAWSNGSPVVVVRFNARDWY